MARLYADEQFPARVVNRLRLLGHDVLTVQQTNQSKYGDAKTDEEILRIAMTEERAILTLNRKDFLELHRAVHWHRGIIACVLGGTPDRLAKAVDSAIKDHIRDHKHLIGAYLDVRSPK